MKYCSGDQIMDEAIGGTNGVRATRVRQSKLRKEDNTLQP